MCQFHRLDGAGNLTDTLFLATAAFDRFLRLVHQKFAFGTGALILRGVATKFRSVAEELQRQADEEAQAASGADAEGEHMKSRRFMQASAKHAAHAASLRKAGWTDYRRPLAPKDNGTRKVVWQSQSRRRLFDIFALVYWGLRARMIETVEQAKFAAESKGNRVTARIGERTAQMKLWRAMGRTLFDIRLLVFNLGRADFRSKHTTPIALIVEGTTYSAIDSQGVCMEFSFAMFRSLGRPSGPPRHHKSVGGALGADSICPTKFSKESSMGHGQNAVCTQGVAAFPWLDEAFAAHPSRRHDARHRPAERCIRRTQGYGGHWRQPSFAPAAMAGKPQGEVCTCAWRSR